MPLELVSFVQYIIFDSFVVPVTTHYSISFGFQHKTFVSAKVCFSSKFISVLLGYFWFLFPPNFVYAPFLF